ncbi:membrane-spanning 4-domains subfamily A member 18-like [Dreissena polymorpha]|uniref:Uncharacterized protein n=1 Tax=Dreissena polymorpha TaxID=45954 RepID=A0A9D4HX43_DREPO|nr:membrane-spanning 4-domains subfamily A member 18-like [Dreissena polymorpha]KAH3735968.1 hypothetical protein DPMN_042529 [Dreissena polymorpha]
MNIFVFLVLCIACATLVAAADASAIKTTTTVTNNIIPRRPTSLTNITDPPDNFTTLPTNITTTPNNITTRPTNITTTGPKTHITRHTDKPTATTAVPKKATKFHALSFGAGIILGFGVALIASLIIYCVLIRKRAGYASM